MKFFWLKTQINYLKNLLHFASVFDIYYANKNLNTNFNNSTKLLLLLETKNEKNMATKTSIQRLLKQAEILHHNQLLVPGLQTWYNQNQDRIYFNNLNNGKKGTILLDAANATFNKLKETNACTHITQISSISVNGNSSTDEANRNIVTRRRLAAQNILSQLEAGNNDNDKMSKSEIQVDQIKVMLDDSLHMRCDNTRLLEVDDNTNIKDLLKKVKCM